MAVQSTSLYVGDLDPDISEKDLIQGFSTAGPVASVRVCRDMFSGASLCYAYVNFFSHIDASKAHQALNHTHMNGKPIRIMWSHRDPHPRKTGIANVFVKNLDLSINSAKLHQIFGKFGNISSCKVVVHNGMSKGFGFVQFDSEYAAHSAIEALNGTLVEGKKLYVSEFVKKNERQAAENTLEEKEFTNLYIKNLDHELTEVSLREKFSEFGKINNVVVMKDAHGKSKGFGFVSFESPEDAKKAVEAMNGAQLGWKTVYVGRAQNKSEREQMLRRKLGQGYDHQHALKTQSSNVYVKNLVDSIDDGKLREIFNGFGEITSVKVIRDDKGLNRGFGFVCFSDPNNAKKAVTTLHGTMIHDKPLYVDFALHKEVRSNVLQQHHGLASFSFDDNSFVPGKFCSTRVYSSAPKVVSHMNPQHQAMYRHSELVPRVLNLPRNQFFGTTTPLLGPMKYEYGGLQSYGSFGSQNSRFTRSMLDEIFSADRSFENSETLRRVFPQAEAASELSYTPVRRNGDKKHAVGK